MKDAWTHPHLPCLSGMRRTTFPLNDGDGCFHRYEFAHSRCIETRGRTQASLLSHVEQERMKPIPGFTFGTRERVSYTGERERIDMYLRHGIEGHENPLLETVEHFPDIRANI